MEENNNKELIKELKSSQIGMGNLEKIKTQYGKLEKELEENEKIFTGFSDNTLEWTWEVDTNGKYTYISPAIEKSLGYKPKEVVKKHFYDFFSPGSREELKKTAFETFAKKEPFRKFINPNVHKDGRIIWLLTNGVPVLDKKGNLIGYRGIDIDITEYKEAQEALRRSEREKAIILDSIQELVQYLDTKLRILWANEAVSEAAGLGLKQLIGRNCYEIWHKRRKVCSACPAIKSFKTGKPAVSESVSTDGRIWLLRTFPVKDKNGNIRGVVKTSMDITERKKIHQLLKENETKLRLTFENAKDAIFWADAKTGMIIKCNKAAENLLEKKRDEVIGQHQTKLHPPKKAKQYARMFKKHIKQRGALDIEAEVVTKSGKIKPVHITASVSLFGNRPIIQGIFRDISSFKETREGLRKTKIRQEYMLTSSPTIIYTCEPSGVYPATFISGNVRKELGYTREQFLANPNFWASLIHPDDKKRVFNNLRDIQKKDFYAHEYRFLKKDGTYEWFYDELKVVRGKNGKPVEIIGSMVNINKRKNTEKKLEEVNKELIKSNKRLKQLTLRDAQTGLYNYRYLVEAIEAEFHRAKRYEHPLSVIMLDIDYFKSINDVYGLKFGDLVLKQLSRMVKKTVRRYDIVVRAGGEEFLVISPGTDRSTAVMLADRLSEAVSLCSFGDKDHIVELRLSIAVVSYPEDKITKAMDLIELSDRILDNAKKQGGNRIYSSLDIAKEEPHAEEKIQDLTEIKFLREKIDKLTKKSNQSLIEAVFGFVKTIKLKDRYTGEHVEKMVHYSTEIANALSLPKEEIELIKQASVLHDLGKVGIGEKILLKARKLSRKEFNEIKRHPQIGVDIIRPIQFLHSIIPLILYHHERWDGNGYPRGLRGEEIPIGARIVAVADVYQALISDRPYRRAYSKNEALEIIRKGAGTHFDPKIVSIFLEVLKQE